MKGLRTLILLALLLLGVFVLANWQVLTAQTTLSLLAFTVEAPLGLILLGALLLFLLLFTAHTAMLRMGMLLESRRHAHELKTQRELADQSEDSRLAELRRRVELGFEELRTALQASDTARGESLSATEQSLRRALEQATTKVTASIGELENRLSRAGPAPGTVDRRGEVVR
jgi:uncharacterized integral membrane protein